MKSSFKILIGVILALAVLGIGVFAGYRLFSPDAMQPKVTAQVILTALRDQGFLVTQTYVFNEPVTIDKNTGSALKDFFFGQTITARGVMETNLGIDLSKITADDIRVDSGKVIIYIPRAQLFNARLVGPLEVENTRGILKRLLYSDNGYNEALAELIKQAEQSAVKPELINRATESAKAEVTRLAGLVARNRTIEVQVKQ
ncbi:MAG: DUF4230 domain-containing protein [Patescibacteria group bacterium]|nr:DUF4230 domain-containing protein [Patescibacteria group bacterium]